MHLLNYIQLYLHELSELMVLQNIDSKLKGVHPKMHVHSTDDLNFRKYGKKPIRIQLSDYFMYICALQGASLERVVTCTKPSRKKRR